jgi:hypothetical protein
VFEEDRRGYCYWPSPEIQQARERRVAPRIALSGLFGDVYKDVVAGAKALSRLAGRELKENELRDLSLRTVVQWPGRADKPASVLLDPQAAESESTDTERS